MALGEPVDERPRGDRCRRRRTPRRRQRRSAPPSRAQVVGHHGVGVTDGEHHGAGRPGSTRRRDDRPADLRSCRRTARSSAPRRERSPCSDLPVSWSRRLWSLTHRPCGSTVVAHAPASRSSRGYPRRMASGVVGAVLGEVVPATGRQHELVEPGQQPDEAGRGGREVERQRPARERERQRRRVRRTEALEHGEEAGRARRRQAPDHGAQRLFRAGRHHELVLQRSRARPYRRFQWATPSSGWKKRVSDIT